MPLPPRAAVGGADRLSLYSDGGGGWCGVGGTGSWWGAVEYQHAGGAVEGWKGAAERRRARAQRSEAINDAVTCHIEKLSEIMGRLVEEAGGEQYRCPQCGSFGPKRPKLGLKDAAEVFEGLRRARLSTFKGGCAIHR